MVKDVTLAFCSIQWDFIRDIRAKFGIPNSAQSADIGQNPDGGISDFRIFSQSFINENCHNSRSSHDTDMKLGLVTKLDKRNTATSKKFDETSYRQVATSLSFFQFMTYLQPSGIRILDAWPIKLTLTLTTTFCLTKPENRTKNFLTQLPYNCFE